MSASFKENRLTVDGRTVKLERPILQVEERPGRVIVLLDDEEYAPDDPTGDRNVIAVDRDGAMLWRITPSGSIASGGPGRTSPFVALEIENRGGGEAVIVYDVAGACYDLDPETGKLSNPVLTK